MTSSSLATCLASAATGAPPLMSRKQIPGALRFGSASVGGAWGCHTSRAVFGALTADFLRRNLPLFLFLTSPPVFAPPLANVKHTYKSIFFLIPHVSCESRKHSLVQRKEGAYDVKHKVLAQGGGGYSRLCRRSIICDNGCYCFYIPFFLQAAYACS